MIITKNSLSVEAREMFIGRESDVQIRNQIKSKHIANARTTRLPNFRIRPVSCVFPS